MTYVVNFSNGQLLPSALNKPKFTLYQKTKDRTKKRRVMVRLHNGYIYVYILNFKQVAETDQLSYVGTNYDPDSTALLAAANCRYTYTVTSYTLVNTILEFSRIRVHRYCVGALDRETGVMTLHRTQHFMLKPHIPGIITLMYRVVNIGCNG